MEGGKKVYKNEDIAEAEARIEKMVREAEKLERDWENSLREEIDIIKREEKEVRAKRIKKEKELEEWKEAVTEMKKDTEKKWKVWLEKNKEREKEEEEEEKREQELEDKQKKIVIIRVLENQDFDVKEWLRKHEFSERGRIRQVGRDVNIFEIRYETEEEADDIWSREKRIERERLVKVLKWVPFEERRRNFMINRMVKKIKREMDLMDKEEKRKPENVAFEIEGDLYVIEEKWSTKRKEMCEEIKKHK